MGYNCITFIYIHYLYSFIFIITQLRVVFVTLHYYEVRFNLMRPRDAHRYLYSLQPRETG